MIFSAIEQMKEVPFKHVFIHGIVRDSEGRKMSKSLGNGIDPLEVIDKYGADALRFNLISGNSPGNDMRFFWEKVEAYSNFANKIWNASRFILMNIDGEKVRTADRAEVEKHLTTADRWVASRLNTVIAEVTDNLEKFELGIAAQKLYDFVWFEFCDWYIELVKSRLYGEDEDSKLAAMVTLCDTMTDMMKLLHPFMPFITEEIYGFLPESEETIMLSGWPKVKPEKDDRTAELEMGSIMEAIKAVRNIRAEMNVVPSRKAKVLVLASEKELGERLKKGQAYFERLASAAAVELIDDKSQIPDNAVPVKIPGAELYLPLEDLVDMEKELERLQKEKANLEGEIKRVTGKLSNQGFVAKAPANVIEEERAKEKKYRELLEKVEERIQSIKK